MGEAFKKRNAELINKNTLANYMCCGCWEWYCIRMDFISTIVVGTATAFCILGRTKIDPVLLALLLRYILTLQVFCIWTLYCNGMVEQQMVSVQRFLNLRLTPQESTSHSIDVAEEWPEKGLIEFNNVTLKYRPNTEPVLRNLSFKI